MSAEEVPDKVGDALGDVNALVGGSLTEDSLPAEKMAALVNKVLVQDDKAKEQQEKQQQVKMMQEQQQTQQNGHQQKQHMPGASPPSSAPHVPGSRRRMLHSWLTKRFIFLSIHLGRYMTEFIGTFLLVLTAVLVGTNATIIGPIAVGSILMSAVFAGGHISGGHYNPAVTLGVYMSGRGVIMAVQVLAYWISQFLGGFCAGLVAWYLQDTTTPPEPGKTAGQAFVVELIFSFYLVYGQ